MGGHLVPPTQRLWPLRLWLCFKGASLPPASRALPQHGLRWPPVARAKAGDRYATHTRHTHTHTRRQHAQAVEEQVAALCASEAAVQAARRERQRELLAENARAAAEARARAQAARADEQRAGCAEVAAAMERGLLMEDPVQAASQLGANRWAGGLECVLVGGRAGDVFWFAHVRAWMDD